MSSFGMSGTNAHTIIEQAPQPPLPDATPPARPNVALPLVPITLSGAAPEALRDQAARLRAMNDVRPLDLGYSTATSRTPLDHRAVVLAEDQESLHSGLDALIEGRTAHGLVTAATEDRSLAFLFSGQGSQRLGMGGELYEAFPVYADAFDAVCAHLDAHLQRPLWGVVFGEDADVLNRTEFTQVALFAVEVALYRLVESWGVRPDFLAGHSIGEIAAAHVAGVLSLEDACALVAARGRLMGALPEGGAMVAVQAPESEVLPLLTEGVDVAAVNGPDSTVLSGDEDAVLALAQRWKHKRLTVSHAFHSHLMDPMLDEFRTVAESLTYHPAQLPIAGQPESVDAEYWVRHVRDAVRFHDAIESLRADGVGTFLEIGPDGVLSAMAEGTPTLRRNRPEVESLLTALATLHTTGTAVDWGAFYNGTGARRVPLPTYAFQHQRYWPRIKRQDAASEALRYRIDWTPVTEIPSTVVPGQWVIVGAPGDTRTEPVRDALAARGAEPLVIEVADGEPIGKHLTELSAIEGVLSLLEGPESVLALSQALEAHAVDAPFWVATTGAVAAENTDIVDSSAAAVWGLGRVIGLEQPGRWGGLVDLPAAIDDRTATSLASVLNGTEDQVAIRADGILARRLVRAPHGAVEGVWSPRGTVLVTGGTGVLGRRVGEWLLGSG
ncbi:acyltransferase domain-containing protein, partial [Streptomyces radicis]|uniref:acyltransferase domain-containing protein n=1 Tax=Streptomyces radicis TaxID=1750517 RepID=UPI001E5CBC6A